MRRRCAGVLALTLGWPWASVWASEHKLEVVVDEAQLQDPLTKPPSLRLLDPRQGLALGAMSLSQFFQSDAALVATAGNAGLGGAANKLNLAGRGINPRFSSRTQMLMDGMPLAIAPYGRPQMTLFPISMAWMDRIGVDLHGAHAAQGPHSLGGQVQLGMQDLVPGHREQLFLNVDQFGQVMASALLQAASERSQWTMGYTTTQGSGYREHSNIRSHGGLVRLRQRIGARHRLGLLSFVHGEQSQIAGGITPLQFQRDPRMSARPLDQFVGIRVGGGVFWDTILGARWKLGNQVVAGLTDRRSEVSTATLQASMTEPLRVSPRRFSYVQAQSRAQLLLAAFGPQQRWTPRLDVAVTGTLEWARLRKEDRDPRNGQLLTLRALDDESIRALAAFATYTLGDRKQIWHLQAGLRTELIGLSRVDHNQEASGQHRMSAILPSLSAAVALAPQLRLFAAYGHTFGPPQFLQISLAQAQGQMRAERGQSAELGANYLALGRRLQLSGSGWFKQISDYADVSAERLDTPGDLRSFGTELTGALRWPTWISGPLAGHLRGQASHTLSLGRIVNGQFDRAQLPWVPKHRVRASLGWNLVRWQSYLQIGLRHDASYLTSYDNVAAEDPLGATGEIPAWTTLWASAGVLALPLGRHARLGLTLSVQNLLDQRQYTRTPDRNAGRVMLPPRTLSLLLSLKHARLRPR